MAGIRFASVTKRFGDVIAVDDLDLDIGDGELLVLLGPSGCGKSTALRLIAGLETPDEGLVLIGGDVVNDVAAKDRDVAMVFQSYALYPHMTVRRNIGFPLKPLGVDRHERDRRAEEAAAQLGLGDLLDRKPGQLSGGQQQRVALARAIVRDPRAFLMDEPLSNLDAKLRADTRAELVELQRRLRTTLVFVTHDQVEAMTMADRIAIMVDGALQQVGTPDEIYERPANVFVARFIGSPPMNTWAARIDRDGEATLTVDGAAVPIAEPGRLAGLGDQVVVGARPEDTSLAPAGIPATAAVVESLGHERLVTCDLGDGERSVVRVDAHLPYPQPGEAVHLALDPASIALFDPATGGRLP